jgi:hypothetical protein
MSNPQLSIIDLARQAQGVFLMGCGGGGDIIQTIPVMNYLRQFGVERFVLGDYAVKWWDKPGMISMGCEVLSLDWLHPAERIHPDVALVSPETRLQAGVGQGKIIHEVVITQAFGVPTVTVSLEHGAQGVLAGINELMRQFELDLLVTVDIGSDSFYSGEETSVLSPLADAISIAVTTRMEGIFALAGYGCDAEMPSDHLHRNVARVMQAGGFLGAHGLTPQDVADLSLILDQFPNEMVEQWPRDAARGKLGTHYCKGWWPIEVTPLAAVTLFFDPKAVMAINPLAAILESSNSLYEAEERILNGFNIWPETRLPLLVETPTSPQIPTTSVQR